MAHRHGMQRHNAAMQSAFGRGYLNRPPGRAELQSFSVNRNDWEAFNQTLYDDAVYPAAGSLGLLFFQNPIGQGTAVLGSGSKTLSDTNMRLAGNLPNSIEFLIQSVEIDFQPATPTVAAGMPSATGTPATVITASLVNEAYIFWRSGFLTLFIGSKEFLQEAPLMKFPPKHYFDVRAAVAETAATTTDRIAFANACGRPYNLHSSPLYLESNQNFSVSLSWPEGLQAITNPARVFVSLDGILYRRSQ